MAKSNKLQAKHPESGDYVFSDKVTRNKIVKHLSDINDTISDEDIRNVITDITSGEPAVMNKSIVSSLPGEDAIAPNDEAKQVPTSWNIIE